MNISGWFNLAARLFLEMIVPAAHSLWQGKGSTEWCAEAEEWSVEAERVPLTCEVAKCMAWSPVVHCDAGRPGCTLIAVCLSVMTTHWARCVT